MICRLRHRTFVPAVVALAALCQPAGAQRGYETHLPFPAPVLNAPYTAERVTTTYQRLADGTQIKHEQVAMMARDTIGRTWTQVPVENKDALTRNGKKFSAWVVWDPITYTMTDRCDCNHVAWVKHYDPPQPLAPKKAVAEAGGREGTAVYLGPVNDRMRYSMESLPAQEIMGLRTVGTKATRVVPAGKDGNDHDLIWTVQSWYSPELKLALTTIVDDPIKGLTKYEIRDLKRVEPDAALFQIPSGYAIKDAVPLRPAP